MRELAPRLPAGLPTVRAPEPVDHAALRPGGRGVAQRYRDVLGGEHGSRIADRLLRLRAALRASIPPKSLGDCILLATWNIRDFGRERFVPRTPEALACIAEILASFDLVAVQEVNDDLGEFDDVCARLGPSWSRIYTDTTAGQAGNGERLAFLFDTRNVCLSGLTGEIVLPAKKRPVLQWARTPVHEWLPGGAGAYRACAPCASTGARAWRWRRRVREIEELAKTLPRRSKKHASADAPHTILMGEFNIFNRGDATFAALEKAGFTIPPQLQSIPGTNVAKTKRRHDQIAFRKREDRLQARTAGVFDSFAHVFGDPEDAAPHDTGGRAFPTWRTYQMSDHLSMWVQLKVDETDSYLARAADDRRRHGGT